MTDDPTKPLRPRLAAVIGWPVAHSLSPLIHRTFAEREGANAHYVPVAAEPGYEAFAAVADGLAAAGFSGANVTIPHKEHALRYALARRGQATAAARAAEAANMLTFAPAGPVADNSDIEGLASAVRSALRPDEKLKTALVLGAGGAGRAALLALLALGVSERVVANRSAERAEQAARAAGAWTTPFPPDDRTLAGLDLLVNATSLGMTGAEALDLDLFAMKPPAIVVDIVYSPLETPLLRAARARGLRTVDGLEMLMAQAVPGYEAWLGRRAVVDADLRARLEAALDQSGRR